VLACALTCVTLAQPARAHDVSYAHLELAWTDASVRAALTVHQDDAALILRVPMPEWFLEREFLARAGPALADSLARRWSVTAGGTPLAFRLLSAEPDPKGRGVQLVAEAPLARAAPSLEVRGPVFPELGGHETFLTVERQGRLLRQDVLDTRHPVARVFASGAPGTFAVLRTFVPAGIHHIAIGPDHILFVLGLLLLGGSLQRLLRVVTAFTLAHSLTLSLAALGLVHVPSRLVEPVIALSIVFVAVETLRSRGTTRDLRAWLAFLFGLVHGFGFASVLAEFGLPREALGWALAGFNLGVEIGQALIVVAAAPLLAWVARRSPRAHAGVVTGLAVVIALAGATWFVQRLRG
jgi:hydrogenase/urease accessory protein HupE